MSIYPRHFQTAIRIGIRRRALLQQSVGSERQGLGLCQIANALFDPNTVWHQLSQSDGLYHSRPDQ